MWGSRGVVVERVTRHLGVWSAMVERVTAVEVVGVVR